MKYPREIQAGAQRAVQVPEASLQQNPWEKAKQEERGAGSSLAVGPCSRGRGRQWRRAGHRADTATRARGSLIPSSWPPGFESAGFAWSFIFPPSFILLFSFCTLDSVSERAGWAAQMSHSLSLDVMEMAEVAALLDRLAAGLETAPSTSGVPSSSALRARPELCDRTCCWSLPGRKET